MAEVDIELHLNGIVMSNVGRMYFLKRMEGGEAFPDIYRKCRVGYWLYSIVASCVDDDVLDKINQKLLDDHLQEQSLYHATYQMSLYREGKLTRQQLVSNLTFSMQNIETNETFAAAIREYVTTGQLMAALHKKGVTVSWL